MPAQEGSPGVLDIVYLAGVIGLFVVIGLVAKGTDKL
jgi:hypothetical protein